jgi:hypothetical protein
MALWDDITGSLSSSWTTNILVGAAVVLVAPIVVPAVLAGVRPLAKMVIKGGVLAYDKTAEMVAEMGEQMSDLVAEARSELTSTTAAEAATPASGSSILYTP